MKTIEEIIDDVMPREGDEFTNDPDDPGGPTRNGVSLRYARGIGLDLDGDQDVDADDIKLVTPAKARELFKKDFYVLPKINTLPAEIQPQMVDFGINSGSPRAILILQELLNKIRIARPEVGYGILDEDGVVGGQSRRAAAAAIALLGAGEVNNMLASAREAYMRRQAEQNPAKRKYIVARDGGLGGWIKRAREFRTDLPVRT